MKDNSAKNNFIMQAGILAAAGSVSSSTGALYSVSSAMKVWGIIMRHMPFIPSFC